MPSPLTYWHTLRHLKPIQLYGRARFRLSRPKLDLAAAPSLRAHSGAWVHPARRNSSMLAPERLCFLNEARDLQDHGWDDPAVDKLWRYNLHYFDDLNAVDAEVRRQWHMLLIERWVRENAPGTGSGWEPYPTSLRIVNWIKWAFAGNILSDAVVHSLAVQVRWLRCRLEYHLLGNHLFANAKALIFAGNFFDGPEAQSWRDEARDILHQQVPEQILPDGGHFERSPMYHALALEDMLDMVNLLHAFSAPAAPAHPVMADWSKRIEAMSRWLSAMCHPDGEISYFNDAAAGVAPAPAELEGYAERLGYTSPPPSSAGVVLLGVSGYVRVESCSMVALLDVAPVGPDYLPGHAHADTLSFELSIAGRRVFVNSGTSCYGDSAERLRQRGTAAHNTVIVNGRNSSEVWSGFRVARRARPKDLTVDANGDIEVRCAHDGYSRLLHPIRHSRQWKFVREQVVVTDTISGKFRQAQARFHLHPAVRVVAVNEAATESDEVLLSCGDRNVRVCVDGAILRVEPSTWHPQFGRSESSVCLVADFRERCVRTTIDWNSAV